MLRVLHVPPGTQQPMRSYHIRIMDYDVSSSPSNDYGGRPLVLRGYRGRAQIYVDRHVFITNPLVVYICNL